MKKKINDIISGIRKLKVMSKVNGSLLVLTFFLSILACRHTSDKKVLATEKQKDCPIFDATRMVNKVLDSTHIAILYGFDKDGRFAVFRNDFINKYNVQITSKKYYLSKDCDSLEHSISARLGKCWFLEFIQIDSITQDIYRLHYALPYKSRGGYYDFNINDYVIVDSCMVKFKAEKDTIRYLIFKE